MPGATVQVLGWDEAFVGFEVEESVDLVDLATATREAVPAASGASCSVGIGDTLVRAKDSHRIRQPPNPSFTRDNWLTRWAIVSPRHRGRWATDRATPGETWDRNCR